MNFWVLISVSMMYIFGIVFLIDGIRNGKLSKKKYINHDTGYGIERTYFSNSQMRAYLIFGGIVFIIFASLIIYQELF